MIRCDLCVFFSQNMQVASAGSCRFNPPVVIQSSTDCGVAGMRFELETVWPCVQIDEWCGKWDAKTEVR